MDDAYEVATEIVALAGWAGEVRVESFGLSQARIVHADGGWWIGLTIPRHGGAGTADLAAGRWENARPTDPLVTSGPVPNNYAAMVLVAQTLVRHLATGSTPGARVRTNSAGHRSDILPDVKQLLGMVGLLKVAVWMADQVSGAVPLVRFQVLPDREPEGQDLAPDASVLMTAVAGTDTTADVARQLADLVVLPPAKPEADWSEGRSRFRHAGALVRPTGDGCQVLITGARRRAAARDDLDRDRGHLQVELSGDGAAQWAAAALFAWMHWDRVRRRQAEVAGALELALPAASAIDLVTPGGVQARVAIGASKVIAC
ncbi:hypothetical protein ACFQ6N_19090 [Kitasatospora sp. NPDC056446]|uniref:hypothetical protein n=1 Tax=Kitasatospora sp. NPDC056446 TaxID=3345819 RepID=UPI0036AA0C79